MAIVGKKVTAVRALTTFEKQQHKSNDIALDDIRIVEFEDGSSLQGIMMFCQRGCPAEHLEVEMPSRPKTKYDFPKGTKVRFKANTRPAYMRGVEGVVSGHGNVKVQIKIAQQMGRFAANSRIDCPVEILERV